MREPGVEEEVRNGRGRGKANGNERDLHGRELGPMQIKGKDIQAEGMVCAKNGEKKAWRVENMKSNSGRRLELDSERL